MSDSDDVKGRIRGKIEELAYGSERDDVSLKALELLGKMEGMFKDETGGRVQPIEVRLDMFPRVEGFPPVKRVGIDGE